MLMVSVVYGGRGGDNSGGVVVGQPMEVAAVKGDGGEGGDDKVKVMMAKTMGWCGAAGGGDGSGGRNLAEKMGRRRKVRGEGGEYKCVLGL
ncbi:hypothetical protein Tco_0851740 [Tanacetum coccineum]